MPFYLPDLLHPDFTIVRLALILIFTRQCGANSNLSRVRHATNSLFSLVRMQPILFFIPNWQQCLFFLLKRQATNTFKKVGKTVELIEGNIGSRSWGISIIREIFSVAADFGTHKFLNQKMIDWHNLILDYRAPGQPGESVFDPHFNVFLTIRLV